MKLFKLLILTIFIITLFQINLFSTITSRVEGVVIDEETQMPIEGASIYLYDILVEDGEEYCMDGMVIQTDINGKFKIDDLHSGKYFMVILKKGYSSIGPVTRVIEKLDHETRADIKGIFSTGTQLRDNIDIEGIETFFLKEGQIKHLRIKLKKEAVLIVKEMVKLPDKSYYVKNTDIFIKHEKYFERFRARINSQAIFQSNYLPAGKVTVKYGYPDDPNSLKEVTLVNGQTTTVEYVDDYTVGTVLKGTVKNSITGKPVKGVTIHLRGKEDGHFTSTDENGEFWINKIKGSGTLIINLDWPIWSEADKRSYRKEKDQQITINSGILNTIIFEISEEL